MIRIEPASPVIQRRWNPQQKRHTTHSVQQFVRRKLDVATFKRFGKRTRALWAASERDLFERAA